MIKVLVVEDSPVVREFLVRVLGSDGDMCVVATAANGKQSLETLEKIQPDVITMDIHMPEMDGLEATLAIMNVHPTPIVIVSCSSSLTEAATAFRALEAGALTVIERPRGIGHPEHDASAAKLVSTVKLMAEVKVVRRWRTAYQGRSHHVPKPRADLHPKNLQLVAWVTDAARPNIYSVIRVNPAKHTGENARAAQAFTDFVTSGAGRKIISEFGVKEYGKSLFTPVSAAGGSPQPAPGRAQSAPAARRAAWT